MNGIAGVAHRRRAVRQRSRANGATGSRRLFDDGSEAGMCRQALPSSAESTPENIPLSQVPSTGGSRRRRASFSVDTVGSMRLDLDNGRAGGANERRLEPLRVPIVNDSDEREAGDLRVNAGLPNESEALVTDADNLNSNKRRARRRQRHRKKKPLLQFRGVAGSTQRKQQEGVFFRGVGIAGEERHIQASLAMYEEEARQLYKKTAKEVPHKVLRNASAVLAMQDIALFHYSENEVSPPQSEPEKCQETLKTRIGPIQTVRQKGCPQCSMPILPAGVCSIHSLDGEVFTGSDTLVSTYLLEYQTELLDALLGAAQRMAYKIAELRQQLAEKRQESERRMEEVRQEEARVRACNLQNYNEVEALNSRADADNYENDMQAMMSELTGVPVESLPPFETAFVSTTPPALHVDDSTLPVEMHPIQVQFEAESAALGASINDLERKIVDALYTRRRLTVLCARQGRRNEDVKWLPQDPTLSTPSPVLEGNLLMTLERHHRAWRRELFAYQRMPPSEDEMDVEGAKLAIFNYLLARYMRRIERNETFIAEMIPDETLRQMQICANTGKVEPGLLLLLLRPCICLGFIKKELADRLTDELGLRDDDEGSANEVSMGTDTVGRSNHSSDDSSSQNVACPTDGEFDPVDDTLNNVDLARLCIDRYDPHDDGDMLPGEMGYLH
ncbi:MAG: hypothetical protein MHM6MM_000427 [Cercozoa sp. M6MM]